MKDKFFVRNASGEIRFRSKEMFREWCKIVMYDDLPEWLHSALSEYDPTLGELELQGLQAAQRTQAYLRIRLKKGGN